MRLNARTAATLLTALLTFGECGAQDSAGFIGFVVQSAEEASAEAVAATDIPQILASMEGIARTGSKSDQNQMREFLDDVKRGNGSFKRIGKGVYLVQRGWGLHSLDTNAGRLEELAWGYDLESIDAGTLNDGTGWVLARSNGLRRGVISDVYFLIAYIETATGTKVVSTHLAGESIPDSAPRAYGGSAGGGIRADYCGDPEDSFSGVAGKIESVQWQQRGSSADRIAIRITRLDCTSMNAKPVVVNKIFEVAHGTVRERR